MDINSQLQPIVQSLVDDLRVSIEQEVREKITQEIINRIATAEINDILSNIITQRLQTKIEQLDFEKVTKTELDKIVQQISNKVNTNLTQSANEQIVREINTKIAQLNVPEIIRTSISNKIYDMVNTGSFPDSSIPHTSLNFQGFQLSGDSIKGGIIENFGSTGIDDRATNVQLTLMDHATVFEGPIWAPDLQIRGGATIDGDLEIKGKLLANETFNDLLEQTVQGVQRRLNSELFKSYSQLVTDSIKADGLDLNRITVNGRDIVVDNTIGPFITESNLQKLGIVRDLQTKGEAFFSQTLYVTEGRVGVNTMEPSAVFVVWDEEVEMITAKRKQDTGYIGTPRYQKLVLGANNKENLTLNVDGSVKVNELHIGKLKITHSDSVPNFEGQIGDIVFYAYPTIGGPIGWVCLGTTRWAKFGTIEG